MGFLRTVRLFALGFGILLLSAVQAPFASAQASRGDERVLKSFADVHPIDVHVHVFKTDPAFQAMLEKLNLKLLDILVMDDTLPYRKELQPQIDDALKLMRSSRGHVALCTTFDPYKFGSPTFSGDAV